MPIRTSDAIWDGNLREGHGHMRFGGGAYDGAFSWNSRFADGGGTNPEELLAAAHAGCFSMALSGDLTAAGFPPKDVRTSAEVHLDQVDGKWTVTLIELTVGRGSSGHRQGHVPEDRGGNQGKLPDFPRPEGGRNPARRDAARNEQPP